MEAIVSVRYRPILLKNSVSQPASAFTKAEISGHCCFSAFNRVQVPGVFVNPAVFASCGRTYPVNRRCLRGQLRQTAQILNGSGQGEFVARAAEST